MWIKKALVVAAWVAAAFVVFVVLIMIEDSGGLELKTFMVIGGLVLWYGLSKQIDHKDKLAAERHRELLAEIRVLQDMADRSRSLTR